MSNSTLSIVDAGNLISSQTEGLIQTDVSYLLNYLDRFMDWNGTLDVQITIKPNSALLPEQGSDVDGIFYATEGSWIWTGTEWDKSNVIEGFTGFDSNGATPDAGFTIYLGEDGTIRNYGAPVWLDPNPQFETPANIPAGSHDFTSIALHEIVHNLAFDGATDPTTWMGQRVEYRIGVGYFMGSRVLALVPEGLPLNDGSHVINTLLPSYTQYQVSGLMRDFGNYEQNRWEIGRIELAVLEDLGWNVNGSLDGLPYTDIDDKSLQVIGANASEILYGDWHDNSIHGGNGNDFIEGGKGSDFIDGGAGYDTIDYSGATESLNLQLHTNIVDATAAGLGFDTLANIEFANGGSANDQFWGNDISENQFIGGDGDDWMHGFGNNDYLFGDDGSDQLLGGAGADLLFGGEGDDYFWIDELDTIYGGGGTDYAYSVTGAGVNVNLANSSLDGVWASNGNDTLDASGTSTQMYLIGYGGTDIITGGSGNDYIWVDFDISDVIDGGAGHNELYHIGAGSVSIDLAALNVQAALGGAQGDLLDGSFLTVSANLHGLGGNDTLAGGSAADWLYGGDGDDALRGNGGNNWLDGGIGTLDMAVYSGVEADYTVTNLGGGLWSVTGVGISDTLIGVELVHFNLGGTLVL